MTGADCDTDIDGCLQIANAKEFDRWANSVTITVHIIMIDFEKGPMEEIIKKALNIYN